MSGTNMLPKMFFGVKDHKGWETGGRYLTPGNYLLKIKGVKIHETVDPKKGNAVFFFVTLEVLAAEYNQEQEKTYAPGDEVSWSINMSQASAKNNYVQWLVSVFPERAQAEMDDEFIAKVLDPANSPALNREMVAVAWNITTSEGKPFTKVKWTLFVESDEAPSQEPEQAQAPAQAA